MAKPNTGDNSDAGDVILNILDKVDLNSFDEIAAMQNGGKIGKEEDADDDNDDDDDDSGEEGAAGAGGAAPAAKGKPQPAKKPTEVEISDEMLIEGLKNTSGRRPDGSEKPDPNKKTTKTKPAAGAAAVAAAAGAEGEGDGAAADNPNPDSPFSVHYDMMVEAGEWEPFEGFDGTKESYLKAREFNETKKVDEGINAWLEDALKNNPDGRTIGKKLLSHLANGGKVSDFIAVQSQNELDFAALEDADEAKAEAAALEILPKYYASIGWKKPQIQQKMDALKKVGGEVDEAKLIAAPYQEMLENREQQMSTQLETAKATEKKSRMAFNNTLQSSIQKGVDFGYFKVGSTKKEKDELNAFYFSPEEETGVPQYSRLLNEAMKDPMFHLMVGDILKNQSYKADPAKVKKAGAGTGTNAVDALEDRLAKSLLNKSLSTKTADAGAGGSADGRAAAGGQTREFKLEEAVVIS